MPDRELTWSNLVLPEAMLARLRCLGLAWREGEVSWLSRGLLLYGRPGTGTSRAARTLARESGCSVLEPTHPELKPAYIGQTHNIRELFRKAKSQAPCILLVDAIDYVMPPRGSPEADCRTGDIVMEFLSQLDGMLRDTPGVFLLCTAYGLEKVDVAVASRLEEIAIPFPGLEQRRELFRICLTACEIPLDADLVAMIDELAKSTDDINGRGIEYLAEAGRETWARANERGEKPAVVMRENMLRKLASAMKFSC